MSKHAAINRFVRSANPAFTRNFGTSYGDIPISERMTLDGAVNKTGILLSLCFGGAFTQVCACDFAIASNTATFGLSEVNWGIIPGGIVSWNVGQVMNYRNAVYYSTTGEPFNGKRAMEIGMVNKAVPASKLKADVMKLARLMQEKSPAAVRYTKEAIRAVRFMNEPEAADYLNAKSDALKHVDKEDSRGQGMSQFLDEKSYRPGLGHFERRNKK